MQERHLNLIKPDTPYGGKGNNESMKPTRSRFRRFLLWTNIMKTSTFNKDGETHTEEKWNVGLVFAVIILYISVIGGFVIFAVFGSLYFLEMRENQRGNDAWKQKQFYDNWQNETKKCQENTAKLKGIILYNQQKKQETPPQYLDVMECGTTTNQQQEH